MANSETRFEAGPIVALVRGGSIESFRILVEQYQRMVLAYFAGNFCDDVVVDELTQDTFVTAFEKLEQYRGDGFPSWLMAIARSKMLGYLRNRQRRQNALERLRCEIALTAEDHAVRFDEEATRVEINRLRICLEGLPAHTSRLIRQCYLEGVSVRELAAEMERSEDAIRSMLFRGRQALRSCMVST